MEHTITFTVEQEQIDLFGHMNYYEYIRSMEIARQGWFKHIGLSLDEMKERGIGAVILHLDHHFKKEALLGDQLVVVTSPLQLGTTSFKITQTMLNQRGERVSESVITFVMFDLLRRRSIPVADEIVQAYKLSHRS